MSRKRSKNRKNRLNIVVILVAKLLKMISLQNPSQEKDSLSDKNWPKIKVKIKPNLNLKNKQ